MICCGVTLCSLPDFLGGVVNGQVTVENMPKRNGKIYRMKITPAAEPSPIFKHRFCVPPRETIAANAATLYLRSFEDRSLSEALDKVYKEYGDDAFDKWCNARYASNAVPVESLLETPAKEVSRTFDWYVKAHMERATRCRNCDWGPAEAGSRADSTNPE